MRKRDRPDVKQVTGYIPKTLDARFKAHIAKKGLGISEALEIVLKDYLDSMESS
jgi:hypothetical protein